MSTKIIKNIEMEIEKLQREIDVLKIRKDETIKNMLFKCPICNKGTRVKNVTIIRPHYYVPPSGCNDGAYWTLCFNEYESYCIYCNKFSRTFIHTTEQDILDGKPIPSWSSGPSYKKIDTDRVKRFIFIKKNLHLFGESLNVYNKGGTIEQIRALNKLDNEYNDR